MSDKIFWSNDFQGTAKGGYYFRAFDLVKFIKSVEEKEKTQVVGLSFEGNNVNVIIKSDEK